MARRVTSAGTPTPKRESVNIRPVNMKVMKVKIRGDAPYVQHAFSQKALNTMIETQQLGHQSTKGKKREARDFKASYQAAMHVSKQGWPGIPAPSFRNAMISACRTVGYRMTLAKLSLFVDADGFSKDGTPLVKITKGKPQEHFAPARNANGSTDVRCRPMWEPGWEAIVTLRWDADQFSASDIINLLARVGAQVGIGEGRPDSRMSAGLGWGTFTVATDGGKASAA